MRRFFLTLTLAVALTTTTLCEAGPRKPAPAPATSTLAPMEEVCQIMGNIAHNSAGIRDNGLPYLEAVQQIRQILAKDPIPGEWGVWFATSVMGNLRWVYEHPYTSARQIRNESELACLRLAEQAGLLRTTAVKERY